MYIKNIDFVPLWAWGKDKDDIKYGVKNLDSIELEYYPEVDLLCDMDFLLEDF